MTTSELMKAMADAGAPFEAILIAVQALDAKDAEIAARDREQSEKRAKDAERKRTSRAERSSRSRPRNVHGRSKDCPPDPPIEEFIPPVSSDEETKPQPNSKGPNTAAKPDSVKAETWRDFLELRKKKRAPVTETVVAGIGAEAAAAGWSLEAALAKCVTRGWQSFEADWVKAEKPPDSGGGFLAHLSAQRELKAVGG